jgi:hypothetical protein
LKRWINLALSLAISLGCIAWTFKDTLPGTPQWAQMVTAFRSANYSWVLPYLGILALVHLCRVLRWGNLLSGLGRVSFKKLNEASAIGFMMLIILPFRLGEFARPLLIAQRSSIRRSAAMTTVVLERIVDGITIAVMLRALLFFVPGDNATLRFVKGGANLMFAVFFGGLCFLLFALWQHGRAIALVRATAGRVSPSLGEKVADIVDGFVSAMRQLPRGWDRVGFFFFTAAYWALNGLGMSVMARAFDCSTMGEAVCSPLSLTLFQGYVVLAVLVMGLMIPAAPGSMGTFQTAVVTALELFFPAVILNTTGLAYAWVIWAVQIAQQIITGFVFLLLSKQSFTDVAGRLGGKDQQNAAPQAPPTEKATA